MLFAAPFALLPVEIYHRSLRRVADQTPILRILIPCGRETIRGYRNRIAADSGSRCLSCRQLRSDAVSSWRESMARADNRSTSLIVTGSRCTLYSCCQSRPVQSTPCDVARWSLASRGYVSPSICDRRRGVRARRIQRRCEHASGGRIPSKRVRGWLILLTEQTNLFRSI